MPKNESYKPTSEEIKYIKVRVDRLQEFINKNSGDKNTKRKEQNDMNDNIAAEIEKNIKEITDIKIKNHNDGKTKDKINLEESNKELDPQVRLLKVYYLEECQSKIKQDFIDKLKPGDKGFQSAYSASVFITSLLAELERNINLNNSFGTMPRGKENIVGADISKLKQMFSNNTNTMYTPASKNALSNKNKKTNFYNAEGIQKKSESSSRVEKNETFVDLSKDNIETTYNEKFNLPLRASYFELKRSNIEDYRTNLSFDIESPLSFKDLEDSFIHKFKKLVGKNINEDSYSKDFQERNKEYSGKDRRKELTESDKKRHDANKYLAYRKVSIDNGDNDDTKIIKRDNIEVCRLVKTETSPKIRFPEGRVDPETLENVIAASNHALKKHYSEKPWLISFNSDNPDNETIRSAFKTYIAYKMYGLNVGFKDEGNHSDPSFDIIMKNDSYKKIYNTYKDKTNLTPDDVKDLDRIFNTLDDGKDPKPKSLRP